MSFLVRLFKSRQKQMNVTICGLDGAGKTTLIKFLDTGEFIETQPTMGINHETLHLPKVQLNIFDLGGQKDFVPMWKEVNEKSDGLVYVIGKTDMRLQENIEALHNILKSQIHEDVTVLVLLHKSDLEGGLTRTELIEKFDLANIGFNWSCFETSAKTGENVYEAFRWFVDNIKEVLNIG